MILYSLGFAVWLATIGHSFAAESTAEGHISAGVEKLYPMSRCHEPEFNCELVVITSCFQKNQHGLLEVVPCEDQTPSDVEPAAGEE